MRIPAAGGKGNGSAPRAVSRNALLVSGTERGQGQLKLLLEGGAYLPAAFAGSGGEARRALLSTGTDLLVVNCPLPDETGVDLACDAAEHGVRSVLLVKAEILGEVRARASLSGVLTLGKPLSKERFHEALSLLDAFRVQTERLEGENRRLRAKLEEVKLVCKAKCLLVAYRRLTEPEAHRLLEKEAMDRQVTRRAVAEEILEEYGE